MTGLHAWNTSEADISRGKTPDRASTGAHPASSESGPSGFTRAIRPEIRGVRAILDEPTPGSDAQDVPALLPGGEGRASKAKGPPPRDDEKGRGEINRRG